MVLNTAEKRYAIPASAGIELSRASAISGSKAKNSFVLYLVFLITAFAAVLGAVISGSLHIGAGLVGEGDFYAYYCGSELIVRGGDLYDQRILEQRQIEQGFENAEVDPRYALYMPAFFLAFSPLTHLPFKKAAQVWLVLNVFVLLLANAVAWRAVCSTTFNPVLCFALSFFYVPVWDALLEGQVSALLLLAATSSWLLTKRGHLCGAGLCLLPFALKPHLGVLPALILLRKCARFKRLGCLLPSLAAAAALILGIEAMIPGIHLRWLMRVSSGPPVESTASILAQLAAMLCKLVPLKIRTLASLLSAVTFLVFWRLTGLLRGKDALARMYSLALALAPWAAPYAWFCDYTLGSAVPVAISAASFAAARGNSRRRFVVCGVLLITQFLALAYIAAVVRSASMFSFFGVVPLLIWCAHHQLRE